MESVETKKRLNWLDYVKGIGIIFVIIGHYLPANDKLAIWIYSFHLALFFIASGLTIKKSTFEMPVRKIIVKYLKSIIVPYYILGFIILLLEIIKTVLKNEFSVSNTLQMVSKYLFLIGLKAEWFLPALFFGLVVVSLTLKLFKGNKVLTLILTAVFSLACAYIKTDSVAGIGILRAGTSAFLVAFGYLISDLFLNKLKNDTKKSKFIDCVMFLLFGAVNIPIIYFNGRVYLVNMQLGNYPVLFFVTGIIGTLSIIFVCRLIDNINFKLLLYTGKNSLVIMAVHLELMGIVSMLFSRFLENETVEFTIVNICALYIVSLCSVEFVNLILPNKKSKIKFRK